MTDSKPRPEVVQAVFSALTNMDAAPLIALKEGGARVTAAEQAAAESLYAASEPISLAHRERWLQAMQLLTGGRKLTDATSWADLFDVLSPERAAQLRDLHDALPDGARAEYDRRYGPPAEGA